MAPNHKDIVSKLHEYYDTRDRVKEIRAELVNMAVLTGLDQRIALRCNVTEYMDGYLVGRGVMPVSRNNNDN